MLFSLTVTGMKSLVTSSNFDTLASFLFLLSLSLHLEETFLLIPTHSLFSSDQRLIVRETREREGREERGKELLWYTWWGMLRVDRDQIRSILFPSSLFSFFSFSLHFLLFFAYSSSRGWPNIESSIALKVQVPSPSIIILPTLPSLSLFFSLYFLSLPRSLLLSIQSRLFLPL